MRRKILATFVLCAAFEFFSSSSAMAQERPGYITFKGGVYTPTDDLDDADFDTGFNGEMAFGSYLSPNFAFEAGVGYFRTDASTSAFDPAVGFWSEDYEVRVVSFTLTAKGLIPSERAEFYVGGGFGMHYAFFDDDFDSGAISLSLSEDDVVFGAHILVGANFNLTEVAFVGLEGKYILTEDAESKVTIFGIPTEIETNLNGYTITAHLGFRF